MNIFHHKFTTGQTVEATEVPHATIQSWMKRGHVVGSRETGAVEGGGTPGSHRRFSFFNVMEIAVAKALTDAGLGDLDAAFRAAIHFAHAGRGFISDVFPARIPSCPFDPQSTRAYTLIFARPDGSEEVPWRPGRDVLASALHGRGGCVLIEVNPIFDRVVTSLGYHPTDVLDLAYGRKGRD